MMWRSVVALGVVSALATAVPALGALRRAIAFSPAAASNSFSACDPLVPETCALPFPNNFWLRPSTSGVDGATVYRVDFGNDTLPQDASGKPIRAGYGGWDDMDGFPSMPNILAYFPNASIDNCARLWDPAASLAPDSPTIILDQDGKRVPHWVELDHSNDDGKGTEYERAFMIWPTQRLKSGGRYIVAIRNISATAAAGGAPIKPSVAFASLRDGTPSSDPDVNGRRALFKDIFARLAAAGVPQSSLQLAWDFNVSSRAVVTDRMVFMRDDALKRVGPAGPSFKVLSVQTNYSSSIWAEVKGEFEAPFYLNSIIPSRTSRLVIDKATGLPVYQGTQPINFTVLVPRSLVVGGKGVAASVMLQYGHGLFGSQREVYEGYLDEEANEHGYVLGAVDWMGLSSWDAPAVAIMMAQDLSDFAMVPDRCTQGMLNALLLMRLMKTGLAKDPALAFGGVPVIQSSTLTAYNGNSQGGILGTVLMGLSQDITRGVLGVLGGPYGLLLPRSVDFQDLFVVMKLRYPHPLDRTVLLQAMQMLWDRMEPAGYVDAIGSEDPLPNTPAHRVVMHYDLGDAQVTWLGALALARSVGAVVFESNVLEGNCTRFGLPSVPDTAVVSKGHVAVGFDFGSPVVPFVNVPPNKKYDTHEKERRTKAAQDMMFKFFTTGEVVNTCGGACRNETSTAPRRAVAAGSRS